MDLFIRRYTVQSLIGELKNGHEIIIEVNASTFIAFNRYAAKMGRIRTKNRFIGETFIALMKKDKKLNEESIKQYLSEKLSNRTTV